LLFAGLFPATSAPAAPSSPPVNVFPSPGSGFMSPKAQIAFRGLSAAQLGSIAVSGSTSGAHAGKVLADSDGAGGSFIPNRAFKAGELVTVSTSLNVVGGTGGRFQFRVAAPAAPIRYAPVPPAPRVRGDVLRFHSRPDLAPAAVKVIKRSSRTAPGDLFVATQDGPAQDGPMVLDPGGGLVWFKRVPHGDAVTDVRAQQYQGKPVLTWWQGFIGATGIGVGEDVINDSSYHEIALVHAANGLSADLHEFQLTPQGTALITSEYPVYTDASAVRNGSKHEVVLDSVVQEIDIPTGLVLFQWDSLDHMPVTDTYTPPVNRLSLLDYFHVNSVDQDGDGNLVVSARNTWAAYKLDHRTGATIWQLGGKHSSFKLGAGAGFAFQHDVRIRSGADGLVTLFDDGAGPPTVHSQSRGLTLSLDLARGTATRVAQRQHSPALLANFEGNDQQLPNGDHLVGWGQQPNLSEFDSRGQMIFDARFVSANSTYRAYRFPWRAAPDTLPAVAASSRGRTTTVYASWNGATSVPSWRVLGGPSPHALRSVANARRRAFETAISIGAQRYVAVQALDRAGHALGRSRTVRAER